MLQDKCYVIVGGTGGIGISAAKALEKRGASLVLVGLKEEECEIARKTIHKRHVVICADATHPDTGREAVQKCIKQFDDFNGLYHIAGASGRKFGDGPLHLMTLEGWRKTFEMNLTSLMLTNQAAVQSFLKRKKSGSILNMSSVLGFSPSAPYFSTHAYAAAKSAVIGFSKSLAAYYAKSNIRFNVLAPGLVASTMAQRAMKNPGIMNFVKSKQPLDGGRIAEPEDMDEAAIFFLSDASKFITGQVLAVDGGWSVSEGQMDHRI